MKPIAGSSPTSRAFPKKNSRARRARGVAYVSIHTVIIQNIPRRFGNGVSKAVDIDDKPSPQTLDQLMVGQFLMTWRLAGDRLLLISSLMSNSHYTNCLKRCLLMPRLAIFDSRVCRGIPNLLAAPDDPATLPLLSASAFSISALC
jgi:hypothetical protein